MPFQPCVDGYVVPELPLKVGHGALELHVEVGRAPALVESKIESN
jgi:hypothetical protein